MDKKKIDYEKLNETITLSNKILKIFYVIVIIGVILIAFVLGKVSGIFKMIGNVLAVCAPFFIGLIFAWLLDPIVSWMEKHKIKRTLATVFVFFAFLVFLILICSLIGPMLINQINEFAKMIPSLFLEVSDFIHNMFSKFSSLGLDMSGVESGIYDTIENIGISLTNSLPTAIVNFLSSTISSVGTFLLGLVVGFYLLLDFDNIDGIMEFIPKKFHESIRAMVSRFSGAFRNFIQGMLLIAFAVSIISSIGYSLISLPSPLLFGIICGITNVIPYIGPWIGGAICVMVGFTISPLTGILAAVVALVVQQIDNIVLEPLIYGKTMKLHPVTIMVGLLIFGYFFGILGMVIATPVLAFLKMVIYYFDEKYEFIAKIKQGEVRKNSKKKIESRS